MSDSMSRQHLTAVRNEIEGRFFTADEADVLKAAIEDRIVTDPQIRAAAAQCWPPEGEPQP